MIIAAIQMFGQLFLKYLGSQAKSKKKKGKNMLEQLEGGEPQLFEKLDHLEWIEYDFVGRKEPYRVTAPVSMTSTKTSRIHIIKDIDGVEHVLPSQGLCGCVVRFKRYENKV